MAAWFGKMPTTSVLPLISLLSCSIGFELCSLALVVQSAVPTVLVVHAGWAIQDTIWPQCHMRQIMYFATDGYFRHHYYPLTRSV